MVYWFSPCQELKKNNSKTVYITFLRYLPCHSIPTERKLSKAFQWYAGMPNFNNSNHFIVQNHNRLLWHLIVINKFKMLNYKTYSGAWYPKVPKTLVECSRAAVSDDWFVKLKSAILAMKSSKRRTLHDLTSRWTIEGWTFSCKYSRPFAAP